MSPVPSGESGGVRAVAHPGARSFLRKAGPWLMLREDEHNLVLGLAAALRDAPPVDGPLGYLLGTVEVSGKVEGCFFRTPPYKLGLTRMPLGAARLVAEAAGGRYPTLPAVFGPSDVAAAVGQAWSELRRVAARLGMPQRMYRLDQVVVPAGVAGTMRQAVEMDLPLAHAWGEAFAEDAGAVFRTSAETRVHWVGRGMLFLWVDGGRPVSMAVVSGRTAHGVRIGYVYTPRERRGRGYASALVAALSQRELDGGARFCVLYTDLRNPTSNGIYPRVGYRPLCDVVDVDFVPAT